MSDYIKREDAIAVIYGQHVGGKEACENARPNTFGADLREIVADIEDIPAADVVERPRWIPVGERLPHVFNHVLVYIPGMYPHPTVREAFRVTNGMWYSNVLRYGDDEITHWMPLPEPPKEVDT